MTESEMIPAVAGQSSITLEVEQIMQLIPHRYPMLLIDRLDEVILGESAIGVKNVTINEPFFTGHFPENPVMPGVLIVESMAQTAAALVMATLGIGSDQHVVYFMSIDNARFRRPVKPGQTLRIHAKKEQRRGYIWRFNGKAFVEDVLVAEASYTAQIFHKDHVKKES